MVAMAQAVVVAKGTILLAEAAFAAPFPRVCLGEDDALLAVACRVNIQVDCGGHLLPTLFSAAFDRSTGENFLGAAVTS